MFLLPRNTGFNFTRSSCVVRYHAAVDTASLNFCDSFTIKYFLSLIKLKNYIACRTLSFTWYPLRHFGGKNLDP